MNHPSLDIAGGTCTSHQSCSHWAVSAYSSVRVCVCRCACVGMWCVYVCEKPYSGYRFKGSDLKTPPPSSLHLGQTLTLPPLYEFTLRDLLLLGVSQPRTVHFGTADLKDCKKTQELPWTGTANTNPWLPKDLQPAWVPCTANDCVNVGSQRYPPPHFWGHLATSPTMHWDCQF